MSLRDDLLSGDVGRILSACGAVRACWDRETLRGLSGDIARIEAATWGIELGGMLRPNAVQLDFALSKLRHAISDVCFCALYPLDNMFVPTLEAAAGHVEIMREIVDQAAWASDYLCRCALCGQAYSVHEDATYHYSWYAWVAVSAPR